MVESTNGEPGHGPGMERGLGGELSFLEPFGLDIQVQPGSPQRQLLEHCTGSAQRDRKVKIGPTFVLNIAGFQKHWNMAIDNVTFCKSWCHVSMW